MKTNTKVFGAITVVNAGQASGYYFFYGIKGSATQRQVTVPWATKLRKEVLQHAKDIRTHDRKVIERLVNGAAAAHKDQSNIDEHHLAKAMQELKDNWRKVADEAIALRATFVPAADPRKGKKPKGKK